MSNKKRLIGTIIFNISETILIFLVGSLLKLPTNSIIIIMLSFMISRGVFGKALHFKSWYRCLIWSLLILLSLFLVFHINIVVAVLFTVFSALIMTGKANIKDMYLWNNENSKYADIEEYIKYHEYDDDLIDFENKLKKKDNLTYLVYKYRFKEKKSFKEISELLDLDNPRIVDKLNNIAFSIRLYCKI